MRSSRAPVPWRVSGCSTDSTGCSPSSAGTPAPADPRVTGRRGAAVTERDQDDDGATVTCGEDRSVRAAAVLGCDGANSTVRALIGATMRDLGPADRWLVLDVRSKTELPVWRGAHQVCDARHPATFMPVTGDRYRWECRMRPGETVEIGRAHV